MNLKNENGAQADPLHAALMTRVEPPTNTSNYSTADSYDDSFPGWDAIVEAAAHYPECNRCSNCGSERLDAKTFRDDVEGRDYEGLHCYDCGHYFDTDDFAITNDLQEALEIAAKSPRVWLKTRKAERRHLLALVAHCLHLQQLVEGGRHVN